MVRLDDVCLARAGAGQLDDVRVDRALSEELHTGDFVCLLVKHVHEGAADDLALRLRIRNSDRKSTRLNSSHDQISYAVFCLKKKKSGITFISGATGTLPSHST